MTARTPIVVLAAALFAACGSTPEATKRAGDEWTIGVVDIADGWTEPRVDIADLRKQDPVRPPPPDVGPEVTDAGAEALDVPETQVDLVEEIVDLVEEVIAPPAQPPFIAQIPCLDYDGVIANYDDPYVVTPEMYAQNMKWLGENGYTGMTMREFLEMLEDPAFPGDGFPPRPVLVFSDTTGSWFYDTAAPILDGVEFKATIGLETDQLGLDWAMTGEQIAELEALGYEIASHSNSHPDLTQLDDEQLLVEVAGSKAFFEEMGLTITTFIYPYGYYDERVSQAVQDAGYTAARAAVDITGGGYSAFDLARRYDFGCAVVLASTTEAEVIEFVSNPKIEVEDLYRVIDDVGELGAIARADFDNDSYGTIFMADAGDSVAFKIHVLKPGFYNLSFRVKTGVEGDHLSTADGYLYTVNGLPLPFQQEGPTVVEQEYIVWGFHQFEALELAAGETEFQVTCVQDWSVLVDYMELEFIAP